MTNISRIDVVLKNAGPMPHSPLERLKIDGWDSMVDVNNDYREGFKPNLFRSGIMDR